MADNNYDEIIKSFLDNSKSANAQKTTVTTNNKSVNKSKKPNNKKNKTEGSSILAKIGKFILGCVLIVSVIGVVCSSVLLIYGYSIVYGDPVFDLTEEKYSQNQTSFIYGYNNKNKAVEITRLHGEENRIWVDNDKMSEYMGEAFIAIEDERFSEHHGVDWKRTIGVTIYNLIGLNNQGGSTITQQLIKNLTDENDVTFVRKFNEILSALNLERNYSKSEILEAYLNTVYLSEGCYGVKTASETYFGKDIKDLNIAECACLAGITKSPTYFDPMLNPENNKERQLYILKKMFELGMISNEEYNDAKEYKLIFTNSSEYKGSKISKKNKKNKNKVNSYYVDFVINDVLEDLQNMGYSAKKARSMIYGGGLKIYSAIDFDIQDDLEDIYENYRRMPDESVQGACVCMNYEGRVLGIIGGTGKKKANLTLNRATQSERQPGSTIKPLSVYGPALEKSLQDDNTNVFWNTRITDKPLMKVNGKLWPTNEGGVYSSNEVTIQRGLANSMNTISARTLDIIGTNYSFDFITNNFHISTLDPTADNDYAPLATGSLTTGVTTLEMTAAYAAFGNGGYYYEPYSYFKIEDSQGNVIIEKDPNKIKESALSEDTAWIMNKLLQTVMTQGTGRSYQLNTVKSFGKTGTTTDNKDRWFIGGTPEYVMGIWYGYDTPKEVHYYISPNPCGTLWNLAMKNIYSDKGVNKRDFDCSDGIFQRNGGWYDKDNLPTSYDNYSESTEKKNKDKDDDKKNNKSTTKKSDSETNETTSANTTEAENNSNEETTSGE